MPDQFRTDFIAIGFDIYGIMQNDFYGSGANVEKFTGMQPFKTAFDGDG